MVYDAIADALRSAGYPVYSVGNQLWLDYDDHEWLVTVYDRTLVAFFYNLTTNIMRPAKTLELADPAMFDKLLALLQ